MVLKCSRCLQEDNFWKIRQWGGKVKTIHLNPKIYKKYGYKVGDEINYDVELEFFFQAMREAGLDEEADRLQDMSYMNGQLVS